MSAASLPLELWFVIIRWATLVPGIFDTSYYSPFIARPQEDNKFRERYIESLPVKARLMNVCADWHKATILYLFEVIILDDNNFPDLVKLLLSPDNHNSRCSQSIRRLDVEISIKDDRDNTPEPKRTQLASILRQCPRLKVYRQFHAGTALHETICTTLLTHSGLTLRRLNLYGLSLPQDFPSLMTNHAPQLETLLLTDCFVPEQPPTQSSILVLPQLHTLAYDSQQPPYQLSFLQDGDFSSLKCIKPISFNLLHLPFLRTHPSSFTTLDLSSQPYFPLVSALQAHLHLETLYLSGYTEAPLDDAGVIDVLSPRLCRVGFGFFLEMSTNWSSPLLVSLGDLVDFFATTSRFPAMKHIRISGRDYPPRELTLFWEARILRMEACGILFDDEYETPVQTLLEREKL